PLPGRPPRGGARPPGLHLAALEGADQPGPQDARRPQARSHAPRERPGRAEQERGEHRQLAAADGALLPRVRQHARRWSLVRHLHPEPAAGAGRGERRWSRMRILKQAVAPLVILALVLAMALTVF